VSLIDYLEATSPFIGTPAERNLDRELLKKPAHQMMTRQVPTLSADQNLVSAASLLLQHNFSCLPVVDANRHLIGVLSWKDIMRARIEKFAGEDPA